jgi:hypothetical protein
MVDQAPIKGCFVGRNFIMCKEIGNRWVEYRDLIDLMDHPSNMEISLCWYEKGTNNKWTSGLTVHLMEDLETIIALASTTYIVDSDAYELHPGNETIFNNLINEC